MAIDWSFEIRSLKHLTFFMAFTPNCSLLPSHPSLLHLFPILSTANLISHFQLTSPLISSPSLLPLSHFFYQNPLWTLDSLTTRQRPPYPLVILPLAAFSPIQSRGVYTPSHQRPRQLHPDTDGKTERDKMKCRSPRAESRQAGEELCYFSVAAVTKDHTPSG